MILKDFLLVFIGGGLGSMVRYALSVWLKPFAAQFQGIPIHTLTANVAGCLLIGLAMGYLSKHPDQAISLILVAGFCGGFTTFSTFSFENISLFRDGQVGLAIIYMILSLVICSLVTLLGYCITAK